MLLWCADDTHHPREHPVTSIQDTLAGSASSPAVQQIAAAFGVTPEQAQRAMAVMLDQLSFRLERNTFSRGGLADLVRAVGDPRNAAYVGRPELVGSDAMRTGGNAILDHILGSKDASRGVAARAARQAGLPAATAEAMLPAVAAMMMGEVSRAAQGPFDDILRRIPGLEEALKDIDGRRAGGGLGRDPGQARGEQDGGGLGMPAPQAPRAPAPRTGRLPEQRPLPLPGDVPMPDDSGGSRYDDLSDILRRGGFNLPRGGGGGGGGGMPDSIPGDIPGMEGGGPLGTLIRAILGALLGFQSRGVIGWLVRLIVMRWGWGFLQRILGRVLGRVLTGR